MCSSSAFSIISSLDLFSLVSLYLVLLALIFKLDTFQALYTDLPNNKMCNSPAFSLISSPDLFLSFVHLPHNNPLIHKRQFGLSKHSISNIPVRKSKHRKIQLLQCRNSKNYGGENLGNSDSTSPTT